MKQTSPITKITRTSVNANGARIHFSAFDALDGTRADFTQFSQLFLRQSFLLAQFRPNCQTR